MLFNLTAGGLRPVLCRFLGAPGETVTLTRAGKSQTVEEGGSIELTPGDYQASGSLSGYSRSITVGKAGDYAVCPDGVIYWYGRTFRELVMATAVEDASQIAKEEEGYISLQCYCNYNSWKTRWAYALTKEPVNTDGYTRICGRIAPYYYQGGERSTVLGYASAVTHELTGTGIETQNTEPDLYTADTPGGEAYIGVSTLIATQSSTAAHRAAAYVYALWLE